VTNAVEGKLWARHPRRPPLPGDLVVAQLIAASCRMSCYTRSKSRRCGSWRSSATWLSLDRIGLHETRRGCGAQQTVGVAPRRRHVSDRPWIGHGNPMASSAPVIQDAWIEIVLRDQATRFASPAGRTSPENARCETEADRWLPGGSCRDGRGAGTLLSTIHPVWRASRNP
jgi:hypothetical protein